MTAARDRAVAEPRRPRARSSPEPEAPPRRLRRTAILCTIGPATESVRRIEALMDAGMNVARLNFSHGTRAEHEERIRRLRDVARRRDRPLAILQDLGGPKIRIGDLEGGRVRLTEGAEVRLTNDEGLGTAERLPTTYANLPDDVLPGAAVLLDDGLLRLRVEAVEGRDVVCRVVEGGVLRSHKGINVPGVEVGTPAVTRKDEEDVRFGLEHGVDYIALSFVRRAADVEGLRELLRRLGREVPIIAKLEKPQAIERLDEILAASDGVMIARGDLGVEIPLERVPILQKEIIARANIARKLVIVATQMLNSMTEHPRPTRAETSDVSNAIFDGTDAVMLSSETASGKHPVEAVQVMDRIARAAEAHLVGTGRFGVPVVERNLTFTDAICDAACYAALETNARVIASFTQSGWTAALLSKYRPPIPIAAFTPFPATRDRMALLWGVEPFIMEIPDNIDVLISRLDERLLREGLAARGETVVIICGSPLGVPGRTNLLKLHVVGDPVGRLT